MDLLNEKYREWSKKTVWTAGLFVFMANEAEKAAEPVKAPEKQRDEKREPEKPIEKQQFNEKRDQAKKVVDDLAKSYVNNKQAEKLQTELKSDVDKDFNELEAHYRDAVNVLNDSVGTGGKEGQEKLAYFTKHAEEMVQKVQERLGGDKMDQMVKHRELQAQLDDKNPNGMREAQNKIVQRYLEGRGLKEARLAPYIVEAMGDFNYKADKPEDLQASLDKVLADKNSPVIKNAVDRLIKGTPSIDSNADPKPFKDMIEKGGADLYGSFGNPQVDRVSQVLAQRFKVEKTDKNGPNLYIDLVEGKALTAEEFQKQLPDLLKKDFPSMEAVSPQEKRLSKAFGDQQDLYGGLREGTLKKIEKLGDLSQDNLAQLLTRAEGLGKARAEALQRQAATKSSESKGSISSKIENKNEESGKMEFIQTNLRELTQKLGEAANFKIKGELGSKIQGEVDKISTKVLSKLDLARLQTAMSKDGKLNLSEKEAHDLNNEFGGELIMAALEKTASNKEEASKGEAPKETEKADNAKADFIKKNYDVIAKNLVNSLAVLQKTNPNNENLKALVQTLRDPKVQPALQNVLGTMDKATLDQFSSKEGLKLDNPLEFYSRLYEHMVDEVGEGRKIEEGEEATVADLGKEALGANADILKSGSNLNKLIALKHDIKKTEGRVGFVIDGKELAQNEKIEDRVSELKDALGKLGEQGINREDILKGLEKDAGDKVGAHKVMEQIQTALKAPEGPKKMGMLESLQALFELFKSIKEALNGGDMATLGDVLKDLQERKNPVESMQKSKNAYAEAVGGKPHAPQELLGAYLEIHGHAKEQTSADALFLKDAPADKKEPLARYRKEALPTIKAELEKRLGILQINNEKGIRQEGAKQIVEGYAAKEKGDQIHLQIEFSAQGMEVKQFKKEQVEEEVTEKDTNGKEVKTKKRTEKVTLDDKAIASLGMTDAKDMAKAQEAIRGVVAKPTEVTPPVQTVKAEPPKAEPAKPEPKKPDQKVAQASAKK
jgi:hypothetical protein